MSITPSWVRYARLWLAASTLAIVTAPALADDYDALFDTLVPSLAKLEQLDRQIEADPNNLDLYFEYAKTARALKEDAKAEKAYLTLLEADPTLDRVRLDLGMLYIAQGKLEESKALLEAVLARNPPPQVRENIEMVLAQVEAQLQEHFVSGSFSVGFNNDTNANAAPSSGNVTIIDTTIPLDPDGLKKQDIHAFNALTVDYAYRPRLAKDDLKWGWKATSTLYQTEQATLDNLNLRLATIRTGPALYLEGGARVELAASHTHIMLDDYDYLRNPKGEFVLDMPFAEDFRVSYGFSYEYRNFLNAPNVTTYNDRSGKALQHALTVRHVLSETELMDVTTLLRRERAKELYYANQQIGLSSGYTRIFEDQSFATFRLGYKIANYDSADLLISSKIRKDAERYALLTLGKQFDLDLLGAFTAALGYQYRDIDSNIQNYEYENHRLFGNLTVGF